MPTNDIEQFASKCVKIIKKKDSCNNVYVTGQYASQNRVELGNGYSLPPTVNIQTSAGFGETYLPSFIIKYNSQGIASWATAINTNGKTDNVEINSIVIDSLDNVLVTGWYYSTSKISLGNGFWLPISSGNENVNANTFIIKYNTFGNVIWAKTIRSGEKINNNIFGSSITIDSCNNVLVTGNYNSTEPIDLGNGVRLPASVSSSIYYTYIIKYNPSGNAIWVKTIKAKNSNGFGITIDSCNNVLVTGNYNSIEPIDLGNGVQLPASASASASYAFTIKYNTSGNAIWAKTIRADENSYSYGSGITIDSSNNVLVTGYYGSTEPIDLGNGVQLPASSSASASTSTSYAYIIKYDPSGNAIWAKTIRADESSYGSGITIDLCNNVLVTGNYGSTEPIDLGNGVQLPISIGKYDGDNSEIIYSDAFTIKYNLQGNAIWAKTIRADKGSQGTSIAIDSCNNVLVTGEYNSTEPINLGNGVQLPPSPSPTSGDSSYFHIFTIKYNSSGNVLWANIIKNNNYSIGTSITVG